MINIIPITKINYYYNMGQLTKKVCIINGATDNDYRVLPKNKI